MCNRATIQCLKQILKSWIGSPQAVEEFVLDNIFEAFKYLRGRSGPNTAQTAEAVSVFPDSYEIAKKSVWVLNCLISFQNNQIVSFQPSFIVLFLPKMKLFHLHGTSMLENLSSSVYLEAIFFQFEGLIFLNTNARKMTG